MAIEATLKESVKNALTSRGIKYTTRTNDGSYIIEFVPISSHLGGASIYISISGNDYVKFSSYPIKNIDRVRRPDVLEALNTLETKYRYLKGMIDSDGDLYFMYDMRVCGTVYKSTSMVMELYDTCLNIMDKFYDEIKKVLRKDLVLDNDPEFNFDLFKSNNYDDE